MQKEEYNNRKLGSKYEDIAVDYLCGKGYKILDRNFHAGRYGELDIIAMDPYKTLVIFECKYRYNQKYGDPLEAVDYRKQRQICHTTMYYFMKKGYGTDKSCRFDVLAVYGDGTIKHIENAFEFVW